jgi:hypothetical protein
VVVTSTADGSNQSSIQVYELDSCQFVSGNRADSGGVASGAASHSDVPITQSNVTGITGLVASGNCDAVSMGGPWTRIPYSGGYDRRVAEHYGYDLALTSDTIPITLAIATRQWLGGVLLLEQK